MLNDLPGKLAGYDCQKCLNKGVVYTRDGYYIVSHECECMDVRRAKARIKNSGIEAIMDDYRFDTYKIKEPWQKQIRDSAVSFMNDHYRKWFFAGGQPGAGKTHICTAIVGEFLRRGIASRYMLWKDEATRLKAIINDPEYYNEIRTLKQIPVLYIDDFFKTATDNYGKRFLPTQGDINLAFEILNYRYTNNLVTIITSERTISELMDFDEAIGSRIYQRTKEYCFNFGPDKEKNWRLRS